METIMYDHIGLRVADLDAATKFYTAVLSPLGHVLCSSGDGYAGFGPKSRRQQCRGGLHVSFHH
jgi:catechol 2,3-dioxygenase-like lactoylglutathione lyase family enzyme